MPTTLKMLGKVRGKRILDLGCGTGLYARILLQKGAKVKGIDVSDEMLRIAQQEVPSVEFTQGSAERLPYKKNEFDIVLAALMMEYLPSWNRVLKEVHRVLKPGGIFVFSTGNPVANSLKRIRYMGRKFHKIEGYFQEGRRVKRISHWKLKNKTVKLKWYHKTYGTVIKELRKHNFEIIGYEDAKPSVKAKRIFPKEYKKRIGMPFFCTWKVRKKKD